MTEIKGMRMQQQSGSVAARITAIQGITHYWVRQKLHMHSKLMGAPCYRLQGYATHIACCVITDHFIAGLSGFAIYQIHDMPGTVWPIDQKWLIYYPLFLSQFAQHYSDITFFHFTFFKHQ